MKCSVWNVTGTTVPLKTEINKSPITSFPWDAFVYASIMEFHLNLEKLGKWERCVMLTVSMSRLPVWVGLMCLRLKWSQGWSLLFGSFAM